MRCLVFVLIVSFASSLVIAAEADKTLDIYWIDVEGGASTLLVTPMGESVLIDSGNPGHRDPERIVRVATHEAGLKKIDHLITTHYHGDHYGGAALLATLLPVGKVYDNGSFDGMPNKPSREYLSFECDSRQVINPGDSLPVKEQANGPQVTIRCIGTRQQFVEPSSATPLNEAICASCAPRDRDGSDNANSIVSVISFGDFRFFDGGDLTWNQEIKLVCPHDLIGPVDVYQVTHHGLDTSNNPVVLHTINPSVAIMNNGDQKGCLPEVFANLKGTPSIQRIFQVHKNLRPDGTVNNVEDKYIANHGSAAECEGHFIHLKVASDSLSYQISIPANHVVETFSTRQK
ncbi:MAG: MBL fold metallo-hydrolase [Planctomycetales bacterium]|nr:MBL fold metallo-hydrolase [Planctomycetales bacterium]